jgi:hypothetical protein
MLNHRKPKKESKTMDSIKIITMAVLAITAWCPVASAAEKLPEVVIESRDVELPPGESISVEFEIKKAVDSEESIVVFEAWLKAKEPAGFAGAMRVFLDDVELMRACDRPTTITIGGGQEFPLFTEHGGWLLAYGKDPEELKDLPEDSVYRIVSEPVEVTKFAIYLPELSKGKHTLKFQSLTAETGYPVMLREVVWKEIE